MALVQGEQVPDAVSVGQDDERRIGQTDLQVAIANDEPLGSLDILRIERLEAVDPASNLGEERAFGRGPAGAVRRGAPAGGRG